MDGSVSQIVTGYWLPEIDTYTWLQIDLLESYHIAKAIVDGRKDIEILFVRFENIEMRVGNTDVKAALAGVLQPITQNKVCNEKSYKHNNETTAKKD